MLISDERTPEERTADRTARKDVRVKKLITRKDDLVTLFEGILDEPRPAFVLERLIDELTSMFQRLETNAYLDPTSVADENVVVNAALGEDTNRRPRAALTSSSTDDALLAPLHEMAAGMGAEDTAAFVENLKKIFSAIIEAGQTDPEQVKARLNTILRIAKGILQVGNDERLESERLYDKSSLELTRTNAQLSTALADLATTTADRDERVRKMRKLPSGIDRATDAQIKLIEKVLQGTLTDDSAKVADLNDKLTAAIQARQTAEQAKRDAERRASEAHRLATQATDEAIQLRQENQQLKAAGSGSDDQKLRDEINAALSQARSEKGRANAAEQEVERLTRLGEFNADLVTEVSRRLRSADRPGEKLPDSLMVFDAFARRDEKDQPRGTLLTTQQIEALGLQQNN
jgi:hypothetical protein